MLTFQAIGDWRPDQVRAVEAPSTRRILPDVDAAIEIAWQTAMARPGVHLFDGPMCRLEHWEASADALTLQWSPTSYKAFLGTNLTNPQLADRFGPDVMANPIGVSPALLTRDGFLMLGRRNSSVAYYPSRVHPFAGAMEPRDAGDPFAAVRRELAEELSLGAEDLAEFTCMGITQDGALRQPEVLFRVRANLTRAEIESQVEAEEHREAMAVRAVADAIVQATNDRTLTPVAVASLLAWGRQTFGPRWFDEAFKPFAQESSSAS